MPRRCALRRSIGLAIALGLTLSVDRAAADGTRPSPGAVEMVPQTGHTSPTAFATVFTADGRVVYSAAGDGTIKAWDVATGIILRSFAGHKDSVYDLALAADGSRLASAGADGFVAVWDARSGEQLRRFDTSLDSVGAVWFLPGDKALLVRSAEGLARTIDIATGEMSKTYPLGEQYTTVRLTRDRKRALGIVGYRSLAVWDAATGKTLAEIQVRRPPGGGTRAAPAEGVSAAIWHPDERHALVLNDEGDLRLVDTRTRRTVKAVAVGQRYTSGDFAFVGGGDRIVLGAGPEIRIVDLKSGEVGEAWDASVAHSPYTTSCTVEELSVSPGGAIIASSGNNCGVRLWDAGSGDTLRMLAGKVPVCGLSVAFSPDGTRLACGGLAAVEVWDLTSLSRTAITGLRGSVLAGGLAFAADGRGVVAGTDVGAPIVWESGTQEVRTMFEGEPEVIHGAPEIRLTPDGARALAHWAPGEWQLFDVASGKVIRQGEGVFTCSQVAEDGRTIACESALRTLSIDLDTGKASVIREQPDRGHGDRFAASIAQLPDATRVVFGYGDGEIEIVDVRTKATVRKTVGHAGRVASIDVSPDGRLFATGGSDNLAKVWDAATGDLVRALSGHGYNVEVVRFSPSGDLLASGARDGTIRLWDPATGKSVALTGSAGDWLVYDDEGHFDASTNGGDLVAAIQEGRPFRVDQLAMRNNRPDLLLERVGLGSQELRDHYRARFQRRLRQAELDESKVMRVFENPPVARIDSARRDGKFVDLELSFEGQGTELSRYNVLINNVPLFGPSGKPIAGSTFHASERVELTAGSNRIEATVLGTDGVESMRAFKNIDYAEERRGDLYYVGFGVSRYRDSRFDLAYPHKDALDLGEVLRAMKARYEDVHVATFVNEEATVDSVRAAGELLAKARPDDTVVLFVAGHGLHARDANAEYYFATYELDPERLPETTASFASIEGLLLSTPARRRVFLMDTCESGELDEPSEAVSAPEAGARGLRSRSTRALVLESRKEVPQRSWLFQRDRYLYNDLLRRSGAVVLSSSRGSELSWEMSDIQNGVFTEGVMSALVDPGTDADRDGAVDMRELQAAVEKGVVEATAGNQHPTIDRDNPDVTIEFPVVPDAAAVVSRGDPMPAPPARPEAPGARLARVRSPHGCGCQVTGGSTGGGAAPLLAALLVALAAFRRKASRSAGRRSSRRGRAPTPRPGGCRRSRRNGPSIAGRRRGRPDRSGRPSSGRRPSSGSPSPSRGRTEACTGACCASRRTGRRCS